jgi:hypothetical protein
VSLFFLFGVSAKHFRLDVSTTCSAQPSRDKGAGSRAKGADSRVKGTDNTVRICFRVPFRRTT